MEYQEISMFIHNSEFRRNSAGIHWAIGLFFSCYLSFNYIIALNPISSVQLSEFRGEFCQFI